MKAKIYPSILKGTVVAPSSKSITHRLLIAAFLSKIKVTINHPLICDDTTATIEILKKLGAIIKIENSKIILDSTCISLNDCSFYLNASGSTARFFIPLLSLYFDKYNLIGTKKLIERLNTNDLDSLEGLDFLIKNNLNKEREGLGLIEVSGKLKSKTYRLNGKKTTQLISGMIFTLPFLADSTLYLDDIDIDNPYLKLTIECMKKFGFNYLLDKKSNCIKFNHKNDINITEVDVEGDYSNASYLLNIKFLNKNVFVDNLNPNSLQGDKKYEEFLKACRLSKKEIDFDLSDCPDVGPALFALSCVSNKTVRVRGIYKLYRKESDRVNCMINNLKLLGADIYLQNDQVIINGKNTLKGNVTLDSYDDHRIVMSIVSIATKIEKPFIIEKAEAINKSYPDFFNNFISIGGIVKLEE